MSYCISFVNGQMCPNKSNSSGFCREHDPSTAITVRKEMEALSRKAAKKEAERIEKMEQREEIAAQVLSDAIAECQSIEGLRKLELKIVQGLVDNTIDPRAGSAITQILKHQERLIDRHHEGEEDLNADQREHALRKAKAMTAIDMLALLGDFAHGVAKLTKAAKTEVIDITPSEVLSVTQDSDS